MSANAGEDDAVLDVKVPTRRRRASDDEVEEAEFHDAAEYAASVADSQAVDQEDRVVADEPRGDGVYGEGNALNDDAAGVEGTEEPSGEQEQSEQLAADRKKAKLREPFEVPTSGAFWLHDDRFGGEEPQAEPPRPSGPADRKARSDTEGRWLHDKFSALELGDGADDDDSENAFSHFGRGRGRGSMRGGGRRGGGAFIGRGRVLGAGGRGRGGGRYTHSNGDGYGSETVEAVASPGLDEGDVALPQRQPRAPRAAARGAQAGLHTSHADDDMGTAAAAPASGRGRGQGDRGGGRSGEFGGRGERRSYKPDGGLLNYTDFGGSGGGRGRGAAGRGRGREEARGGYANGGRGVRGSGGGCVYDRGTESYDRGEGPVAELAYEGGRGKGRGGGRSLGDYQGGRGLGRGGAGAAGRGPPGVAQQQKAERILDNEFPLLPGSAGAKPSVYVSLSEELADAVSRAPAPKANSGAAATQGVRRYSKMAGKVGCGADGATAATAAATGAGAPGLEPARPRGAAVGEGGGTAAGRGVAAPRASKLSAAAPTFEPAPAPTGRQQQPQLQAPIPSVPVAFGAPLQPMTVITAPPPPEAYGVPPSYGHSPSYPLQHQYPLSQSQGSTLPTYAPMQHQAVSGMPPPPPPPPPSQQQQPGMMVSGSSPMAPPPPPPHTMHQQPHLQQIPQHQPQQQQYGAGGGGGGYGASPSAAASSSSAAASSVTDMEAWFQDAYQKALATGMDPQQAYSAVQGYLQGMNLAFQQMAAAQRGGGGGGGYPGMVQQQTPIPVQRQGGGGGMPQGQ